MAFYLARLPGMASGNALEWRLFDVCGGKTMLRLVTGSKTVLIIVVAVLLAVCSSGYAAKPIRIGLVLKAAANPYWQEAKAGAEKAVKELGNVELVYLCPEREQDVAIQVKMIEDLIEMKVDAIVVAPSDSWGVVPAIEDANRAGIPVVCIDTKAFGGKVVCTALTDNVKGAALAADWLANRIGKKGKVAVLSISLGMQTGRDRLNGFADEISKYRDIKVASVQMAGGERQLGMSTMENILTANPDLAGVFCANDQMALGAVEALDAVGKLGKIPIIGFDGVKEALEEVKKGRLDATIKQFPAEMGYIGVKMAVEALKPEAKIQQIIDTGVEVITKANVDKYLK